jgi:glycosyltransferase involved in cell wall biosynthesis
LEAELKNDRIKMIHLGQKKFDPRTLIDFVKIIREKEIHILHLHQYASSNFGRLAGKITGIPSILHAHGPDWHYPWYQWIADRLLAGQMDCVLAVSNAVREECVRNRAISREKIVVITNGIPLDCLKPLSRDRRQTMRGDWNIPLDSRIVGTITRLHQEKGNHYLLEAAAEVLKVFPGCYFLIVGDGPLSRELKQHALSLGVGQHVIFTGFQKDVGGMLSLFDIMVIASISEGFPQALLEAMVMGKAVVATEVGGIGEILRHGEAGFLVPPRDPQALAGGIIHLLANECDRARLADKAQEESRKYSLDTHLKILEGIYERAALGLLPR